MSGSKVLQRKNMLLFGAPGVGKGTFGKFIKRDFQYPIFSMGDYFRDLIKQSDDELQDPFIKHVKETLKKGHFIDDQTVMSVVKNIQGQDQYSQGPGIILDGIPRTSVQAEMLKEIMSIDMVFNFYVKDEILIEKLMGRRVCPECNANFNVATIKTDDGYDMDPLLPKGGSTTHCSKGIELAMRDDDKVQII